MPLYIKPNQFVVIAKSTAAVTLTGSIAITTLGSFVIPGGTMQANGMLRIQALYTSNSDASTKYIDTLFGAAMAANTLDLANVGSLVHTVLISNVASQSVQIGSTYQVAGGSGVGSTLVSGTENTAANVTVALRCQLADAADNVVLRSWVAEILSSP